MISAHLRVDMVNMNIPDFDDDMSKNKTVFPHLNDAIDGR